MRKFVILIAAGLFFAAIPASGQTGDIAPAKPKPSTAQKTAPVKTGASSAAKSHAHGRRWERTAFTILPSIIFLIMKVFSVCSRVSWRNLESALILL